MLLAATAARAFDFWADNADGKRLYYSYDGNSKVKVVNPDWDSFTQPSGELRIPATVIHGATTFSVKASDTKAFEYCADITTVVIPEGVTSIGRMAFAYCTALDSVALPSTLTSIGTMAFTGTSFFSSSHLNDDGLLIAGNYLIGSRSSITGSIAVPDHVQGLGNMAFYSTHVERVTLPAGLRFIGENAFQDCMSLDTVELLGTNPPTLAANAFTNVNGVVAYVPCHSAGSYQATTNWNSLDIAENCPDVQGIAETTAATFSAVATDGGLAIVCSEEMTFCVSDAMGRCVAESKGGWVALPSHGIYFVNAPGMKAVKVVY